MKRHQLINNLGILVGILFRGIAFEGLRNNIIFSTSVSSLGLRKKEFILIGGKIMKIIDNRSLNISKNVKKMCKKHWLSLEVQSNFGHYQKYWMELH